MAGRADLLAQERPRSCGASSARPPCARRSCPLLSRTPPLLSHTPNLWRHVSTVGRALGCRPTGIRLRTGLLGLDVCLGRGVRRLLGGSLGHLLASTSVSAAAVTAAA